MQTLIEWPVFFGEGVVLDNDDDDDNNKQLWWWWQGWWWLSFRVKMNYNFNLDAGEDKTQHKLKLNIYNLFECFCLNHHTSHNIQKSGERLSTNQTECDFTVRRTE